jgi:hypothetical protein
MLMWSRSSNHLFIAFCWLTWLKETSAICYQVKLFVIFHKNELNLGKCHIIPLILHVLVLKLFFFFPPHICDCLQPPFIFTNSTTFSLGIMLHIVSNVLGQRHCHNHDCSGPQLPGERRAQAVVFLNIRIGPLVFYSIKTIQWPATINCFQNWWLDCLENGTTKFVISIHVICKIQIRHIDTHAINILKGGMPNTWSQIWNLACQILAQIKLHYSLS